MVMGLLGLLEVLITCAGGGRGRHVSLRGNGVGGIKGGDQPRPLARPRPLHKGLGWREAQAQNVVADTARGLRGARGLEAGQLLRMRGRRVRERGRESEGEVNSEGERVKNNRESEGDG